MTLSKGCGDVTDGDITLVLDDNGIEDLILQAFKEGNEVFGRDAQLQITSPVWDWPRSPSPRDIVASPETAGYLGGGLRSSYLPEPGRTVYDHNWTVNYAAAVKNGARLSTGTSLPARDWTKKPLEDFADNVQKILDGKVQRYDG